MTQVWKRFTADHAELWKFIKFLLTCGGSSVLYFAVYYPCEYVFFKSLNATPVTQNAVLSFLGIKFVGTACSYFIASFCSFSASYVVNRKVTFRSNSNVLLSTVLYVLMTVFTTAFTTWFGAFMKTVLYDHGLDGGLLEVLMPCVVMCIPFAWTYPLQRFVIYKNKRETPEEPEKGDETT